MLDKKRSYGQVFAMPGVHFEQDGKFYDNHFWQVDETGKIIDPDYEYPEQPPEAPPKPVEPAPEPEPEKCVGCGRIEGHDEDCPTLEPEEELELVDRIKIIDSNMDGYLGEDEIKKMLDTYNREYNHRHRRSGLLKMLKEEIGLE